MSRVLSNGKAKFAVFLGLLALLVWAGTALSQPAAPSEQAVEALPADATKAAGTPLPTELRAYASPEADIEAAARKLQAQYAGDANVRIAADPRTGQLLIVGPPEVHAQLTQLLKPIQLQKPDAQPAAAANAPPEQPAHKELALKTATAAEFETALANLVGRQLPVTIDRDGELASYTLLSKSGSRMVLAVDRKVGQVALDGPASLVDAWARVVTALDTKNTDPVNNSRVVPIRNASTVASGAIQKAMSIIGQEAPQPPPAGKTDRLVSMLFQPRDGKLDPAKGADGKAADGKAADGKAGAEAGQPPATAAPGDEPVGLIGPVQIEFLEGLDTIIIRGHPRDVEQVQQIIRQIEEQSLVTVPVIEQYFLKYVDDESMATLVRSLYDQVLSARQGRVSITALNKPNSLLLIGREESVKSVMELIQRLDQPVNPETQFQIFELKHTSATEALTTVQQFLSGSTATTPGGAALTTTAPGLGTRALVTADYRTNSLIVRASPRDLEEVSLLIKRIDVTTSAAVNELRVFPLKNSLAEDLAPVLQNAINGQQTQGRQQGQQGQQGQQFQQPFTGLPGGGNQQFQQGGQQGQQGRQQGQQPRSAMLQFFTLDAQGKRILRSGILTDVRVTADARGNSLLVSAPAESMELIEALIRELDRGTTAQAQIKVFTIVNSDAQGLVTMLQSLFGLPQTGQQGQGAFLQNLANQIGGDISGDSPLVSLRFSVDARTNSIVASGSAGDLAVVEAILLRLDESDVRQRKSIVYRLKNAPAQDVATSINQFLTSERQVQQINPNLLSPFEQIEREVVVVPEVVSNSLIVSATPRFFDEVRTIVEQLDARPPMVMIQVLIAEITLANTDEFGVELGLQDSILFDRSLLGNLVQNTTTTTFGNPPTTVQQQTIVAASNTPGFNFNNQPLGNSGSATALNRSNVVGSQGLSNFAVGRINNELGFGGLVLSASSESVSFLLRALSESRRLDVLARPQVMTLDNQPAFVQVGQRVPQITATTITNGVTQNSVTFNNVGLILEVQPRISPDGLVVMQVAAERSDVGPEAEGIPISINLNGDVIRSPRINLTTAQTTVSALNGQTIVLGGLITKNRSETHRRVPFLADIPVLGHLFRYDNVQNRRTELLIVLTPRIVRDQTDADIIKQVEASRMSWCLADVIKMGGDLGLRGRDGEWTDAETSVIYPHADPAAVDSMLNGEQIPTPPPTIERDVPTPPPGSPSGVELRVAPPPGTSAPVVRPPLANPPTSPPPASSQLAPPSVLPGANGNPIRSAVPGPTLAPPTDQTRRLSGGGVTTAAWPAAPGGVPLLQSGQVQNAAYLQGNGPPAVHVAAPQPGSAYATAETVTPAYSR